MPIIQSAKKKMLQDVKRTEVNKKVLAVMRKVIREFKTTPTDKKLPSVFTAIDKAAKKKIIHSNKAARLKSQLSKKIKSTTKVKSESKK